MCIHISKIDNTTAVKMKCLQIPQEFLDLTLEAHHSTLPRSAPYIIIPQIQVFNEVTMLVIACVPTTLRSYEPRICINHCGAIAESYSIWHQQANSYVAITKSQEFDFRVHIWMF